MTQNQNPEENRLPLPADTLSEVDQAQEALRTYINMVRGVGATALDGVQPLLDQKKAIAQTEEERKAEHLKINENLRSFVGSLPIVKEMATRKWHSFVPRYMFQGDLESVRFAQASAWWISDSHFIPRADRSVLVSTPYYEVGYKMVLDESKNLFTGNKKVNQNDAWLDLLLMKADGSGTLKEVRTSMKMHDRSKVLAIHRLSEPIDKKDLELYGDGQIKDGFMYSLDAETDLKRPNTGIRKLDTSSTRMEPKLLEVPSDPRGEDTYWSKHDGRLLKKGVPVGWRGGKYRGNGIEAADLSNYNIGQTCLELALLFNKEDEYNKTIGNSVEQQRKRMSQAEKL